MYYYYQLRPTIHLFASNKQKFHTFPGHTLNQHNAKELPNRTQGNNRLLTLSHYNQQKTNLIESEIAKKKLAPPFMSLRRTKARPNSKWQCPKIEGMDSTFRFIRQYHGWAIAAGT
jgi:hypothetical protein